MISKEYEQTLAKWEDKNGHRMPRQTEQDILVKQAQKAKLAKELAFKPRLDMAIDKMIRHRFHDLETAMRKEPRIAILFQYAKVSDVASLQEREKRILLELLK